jgi:hypothetical protein
MPLRGACGQPLKVHDENVNATEHAEHAKSDIISDCAQAWSFLLFLSGRETRGFKSFTESAVSFSPLPALQNSSLARFPQRFLFIAPTPSSTSNSFLLLQPLPNHSRWILAPTGLATTVRFSSHPPAPLAYPPPHSASSLLRGQASMASLEQLRASSGVSVSLSHFRP